MRWVWVNKIAMENGLFLCARFLSESAVILLRCALVLVYSF